MDEGEPVVDLEPGTMTPWWGDAYGFAWSWSGPGCGRAPLWAGDPNGPCFLEDDFTIRMTDGRHRVEWSQVKGQSRWRPERDEDELDYVPLPLADVWGALEELILAAGQ
jgi:hypothetical protein